MGGPRWRLLLFPAILLHSDHIIARDNDDPAIEEPNGKSADTKRRSRRAAVFNDSPFHLALYTVQDEEEELVTPPEGVIPGANFGLRTATGKVFRVHELPHAETGLCQGDTTDGKESCRSTTFTIPEGLEPGTLGHVCSCDCFLE
jgi:hypothetical protein